MTTSISCLTSGVFWHSLSKIMKSDLTFVSSSVVPALSILSNEVSTWFRSEFVGCVPDIISLSCYRFTLLEVVFEIYSFHFQSKSPFQHCCVQSFYLLKHYTNFAVRKYLMVIFHLIFYYTNAIYI